MAVSNIKVVFHSDIKKVWDTVTSLHNYAWRSDLDRIEIKDEKTFVEYTKEGYATTFTITVTKPCERWEFDMENDNMKGHWTGIFTKKGDETKLDFTETAEAKKFFMKPFVKLYLKKQQKQYISDLQKELSNLPN
ncbi:MAG: SRPBCC family protein [Clostridium sp.]|nr:SRPBCC family protein [Clostridium sp.]MCM1459172.1 SRPBCC family protein [Bacteroides sp.]